MAESTGPKSSRGQWRVEIREQFLEADSFLLPHATWGSKLRLSGWVAQYLSLQTHLTGPNLSFYPGITVDVSSRHPTGYMGQRTAVSVVQHKIITYLKHELVSPPPCWFLITQLLIHEFCR